jgi:NADH-quinone oxidoreductase subunit J
MNILLLTIVLILAVASLVIKKSVPAMISFALMMFMLGLYYMNIDAKLLGLFQIFIYTGGIVVLLLFGITIIGIEFPKAKVRPWSALSAALVFAMLVTIFFRGLNSLTKVANEPTEELNLFAHSFSDMVILFALIGSSLLYGTIKMTTVLHSKRRKDV